MARLRHFGSGYSHFGEDTTGHDVKAFGDTTGKYFMWDASANQFILVGTMAQTGNQQVTGTLTVGVDATGHDVKFFGDTTGKYALWDESADAWIISGDLEVTGQHVKGERFTVTYPQVAAADVAKTFFIAPAACKIISGYERHVTVAGQAGVLTVEKLTTGEAPSAGDDLFTTGWDLTSTANTPVSKTAVTTAAGTLAAGDALCLKLQSGNAASYDLGTVTVTMEWL